MTWLVALAVVTANSTGRWLAEPAARRALASRTATSAIACQSPSSAPGLISAAPSGAAAKVERELSTTRADD